MFRHRVERQRQVLRVTLELELEDVARAVDRAGAEEADRYHAALETYCLHHVVPDVFEVTAILMREDDTLGVVKWFNDARGYGFIRSYSGKDVFVHYSDIAGTGYRTLAQGQRVRFKCREGEQRLSACDVELLDAAEASLTPSVRSAASPVPSPHGASASRPASPPASPDALSNSSPPAAAAASHDASASPEASPGLSSRALVSPRDASASPPASRPASEGAWPADSGSAPED